MPRRFRLGLLLGLAALALAWFASVVGGLGWLLVWPASSFAWVAACYLFIGARGFGKRHDGRLRPVAVLALVPFIVLRQLIWSAQGALGSEPPSQRVFDRVVLGRHPAKGLPGDVTSVVDFTCEFSAAPHGRRLVLLPCLDGIPPSVEQIRAFIDLVEKADEVVYVHCASGHGRSATAVVAWLVATRRAETVRDAEAQLQRERPGVRLSSEQAHRAAQFGPPR